MPHGIIIPANPEQALQARTFTRLQDYQQAVDGFIEALDIHELDTTIYANDEGLLHKLPLNQRATLLLWLYRKETRRNTGLTGDVVLIGMPDEDGDTTDLPETVRQTLLHDSGFRNEVKTIHDPKWYGNQAVYLDFFDAARAAYRLLEEWTATEQIRITTIPPLADGPMKAAQA